jgi:hypothetical protein
MRLVLSLGSYDFTSVEMKFIHHNTDQKRRGFSKMNDAKHKVKSNLQNKYKNMKENYKYIYNM